jgi:hypothetical protein
MSQNSPRISSIPSGAFPLKTSCTEAVSSDTRSWLSTMPTFPTITMGRPM